MNSKAIALVLTVAALPGCGGGGAKISLSNTLPGANAAKANQANMDPSIAQILNNATLGCLPLQDIAKDLTSRDQDAMVAYIVNLDLGQVDATSRGFSSFNDDTVRAKTLLTTTPTPRLIETVTGDQLKTSLLAPFLAVSAQTDCTTVTFTDPTTGHTNTFSVQGRSTSAPLTTSTPPTPGAGRTNRQIPTPRRVPNSHRIELLSTSGERRVYTEDGRNLMITVDEPVAAAATSCSGASTTGLYTRATYMLVHTEVATAQFSITANLGRLLNLALVNVPSTVHAALAMVPVPKASKGNAGTKSAPVHQKHDRDLDKINVAYPDLELMSENLAAKRFSDLECPTTASKD